MKTACSSGIEAGHAMQVADRQREEFAKRPGMFDDAQDGASRAMAAEAARAPIAMAASEIDFAGDALADPRSVGGVRDFADEFVAGRAGESVVSALKFEIGGTDSGGEQADAREAFRDARQRLLRTSTRPFRDERHHVYHRLKFRDMASATQSAAAELVVFQRRLPRAITRSRRFCTTARSAAGSLRPFTATPARTRRL